MARRFFEDTGRRGDFREDIMRRTLAWLEESGVLITSETGIIGGFISPIPPTGELVAQEFLWWGNAKLHRRFEAAVREKGATAIQMIALNKRVARYYRNAGYRKLETVYLKEF